MSIDCVKWAMEQSVRGPAKGVLLALAYHANAAGTDCYPGLDRIAFEGGCDRATAVRAINKLAAEGYLTVGYKVGPNGCNSYALHIDSRRVRQCTVAECNGSVAERNGGGERPSQRVKETVAESQGDRRTVRPNKSEEPSEEPSEENHKRAREVPENLRGFDAILRESGNGHYDPTAAFYVKVSTKYAVLDLEEEALKAVSWLKGDRAKKLKRTCSTAFVLNWLKNAMEDRGGTTKQPAQAGETGRVSAPTTPGGVSPFAKYGRSPA